MSTIIENVARGAKNQLTGGDSAARAAAQDQRGADLIKQLAVGGLAVGGGAGAVVALINYMKSLKAEDEIHDESRLNDDTLYIPANKDNQEKAAADEEGGVNRWVAPGLALTGGILTAGGAYALTQAVYNYLQKKQRQAMLDEAQGEALAAADIETEKAAAEGGAKMNFYDLVTAFPVAVPLLAALASGGVAYTALKKTFPTVKAPKSKYPKRIRQVSREGKVDDYEDEKEVLKSASVNELRADNDCEDAALEFLMTVTDQMSIEKKADHPILSDIINATAKNGLASVTSTYQDAGLEGLVEITKGASAEPADTPNKMLAVAALSKSARLRPIVSALAGAEYQEMAPAMFDMAVSHGEEHMDKMAGVASLMQLAFFRPQMLGKSAAANPLMEELQELIDVPGVEELSDPEVMEDALTSDALGALSEDAAEGETADEVAMIEDGDEINDNPDDPVDTFMEMEGKSPLLETEDIDTQE